MTELETRLIALVKSMQAKQETIIQELKTTAESIEAINNNQTELLRSLENYKTQLDSFRMQLKRLGIQ